MQRCGSAKSPCIHGAHSGEITGLHCIIVRARGEVSVGIYRHSGEHQWRARAASLDLVAGAPCQAPEPYHQRRNAVPWHHVAPSRVSLDLQHRSSRCQRSLEGRGVAREPLAAALRPLGHVSPHGSRSLSRTFLDLCSLHGKLACVGDGSAAWLCTHRCSAHLGWYTRLGRRTISTVANQPEENCSQEEATRQARGQNLHLGYLFHGLRARPRSAC